MPHPVLLIDGFYFPFLVIGFMSRILLSVSCCTFYEPDFYSSSFVVGFMSQSTSSPTSSPSVYLKTTTTSSTTPAMSLAGDDSMKVRPDW